jgi:SagB-type dehydrogenase family enzyme
MRRGSPKFMVFLCVASVVIVITGILFSGCGKAKEPKTGLKEATAEGKAALPPPDTGGGMPLNEALKRRRSQRSFTDKDLELKTVSQLLWAAQGVTEPSSGFRTAPSAGALYPLEVFVLEKDDLFHYLPVLHSIEIVSRGVDTDRLADAAAGQVFVAEAPVVIVVGAVFERTRAKYGERADRYVHMEAGHAAQNLLLEAVSLGLGAVPVGAFYDKQVSKVLGLPADVSPLYLIPVGYPGGSQ